MSEPSLPLIFGMALCTVVGAAAQRATGMGFALLASPFLVLVLGPFQGILVINVAGVIASSIVLLQVGRDVDWPRAAVIVPMGVIGVIPGAIAVDLLPGGPLAVVVSLIVILGLAGTMLLRGRTLPHSPALGAAGGLASGFMSVTAGVGGPGVVVYARATGWEHRHFAATAQLVGVTMGIVSLAAKRSLPSLGAAGWTALLLAIGAGLLVGNVAARRIDEQAAMRAVMVIAMIGALLALGQGIMRL
ncbi:sulfite exporter TauE/SafE family protein [Brachybacterium hainanense]|uniref:Probable membrane transporter protein n=1 Tax=Brachybacterium hainanense TaxID=1541174 RepID=A0ABV6RBE8_9MICO